MIKKTIGLPYWIQIICMVFMTFSLLQGFFSITARAWFWIPLACIVCFLLNAEVFRSRQFVWFALYLVVVGLNLVSGRLYMSLNSLLVKLTTMMWAISLPFVLFGRDNKLFIRAFLLLELFVIFLTSALSIIVDITSPGIVRQVASYITYKQSDMALLYYRLGVCEYGLPHAIPIILPAIILYARKQEVTLLKRIIAIGIILLMSYFVFISGVTTAILLSVFAIIGSLLLNRDSRKKTYARLIVLSIIILPFIKDDVMLSVLSNIKELVPVENSFHGKIESMENTLIYDEAEGSVASRDEKYQISRESFRSNPIFGGSGSSVSGGHSVILDTFASYGILGGIPLVLLIFFHLRFIYRKIPDRSKSTFLIGAFCFVAMLATKNMSNVYTWMFVSALLPMMLIYEFNSKISNQS